MCPSKFKENLREESENILDSITVNYADFKEVIYEDGKSLFFDEKYSFHNHFGHKRKTTKFPFHKNMLQFLTENSQVNIFITLDENVKPIKKIDQGFLINMVSYCDFCKTIGTKTGGRLKAFLGQNLSIKDINLTETDKDEFIRTYASEKNIVEVVRGFTPDAQNKILDLLNSQKATNTSTEKRGIEQIKIIETTDEILSIFNGLKEIDPKVLKILLDKLNKDDKITNLLSSLTEIELTNLFATHRHNIYQTELDNLEKLLSIEETGNIVEEIKNYDSLKSYMANQPEKIFQNWIEQNLWVFGVEYIKKHDARKIALFSEGDLLMESIDGFLDLIELKRPRLDYEIFKHDLSHNSYYPSPDLSKAIGQCLFYLEKMDDYKLNLEKEHKVKILRPRIKIIAGRTNNFKDAQFQALRMLNSNLNHIQIISYDYLLSCGKKIISIINETTGVKPSLNI
ncbi:MAG: DUF4263 domain-containing protein [Nitrospirae bacterium]|nr:DUF4263 domain-containing protein [Nitrospirota bacterium]